jgi:hypothetical protein
MSTTAAVEDWADVISVGDTDEPFTPAIFARYKKVASDNRANTSPLITERRRSKYGRIAASRLSGVERGLRPEMREARTEA